MKFAVVLTVALLLSSTASADRSRNQAGLCAPRLVGSPQAELFARFLLSYESLLESAALSVPQLQAMQKEGALYGAGCFQSSEEMVLRQALVQLEGFARDQGFPSAAVHSELSRTLREVIDRRLGYETKARAIQKQIGWRFHEKRVPDREIELGHAEEVKFSVDGRALFRSHYKGRRLSRFDLGGGRARHARYGQGRTKDVVHDPFCSLRYSMAESRDGKRLYVGGPAATEITVFDAETLKPIVGVGGTHKGRIVRLSPDGTQLAVSNLDRARIIEVLPDGTLGEVLMSTEGAVRDYGMGNGSMLITGHDRIFLTSTDSSGVLGRKIFQGIPNPSSLLQWDIGGGQIVLGHQSTWSAEVIDLTEPKKRVSLEVPRAPFPTDTPGYLAFAISPDGRWIAGATSQGRIVFWESGTGEIRTAWVAHERMIGGLEFSPDSETLLSHIATPGALSRAFEPEPVRLWSVKKLLEEP